MNANNYILDFRLFRINAKKFIFIHYVFASSKYYSRYINKIRYPSFTSLHTYQKKNSESDDKHKTSWIFPSFSLYPLVLILWVKSRSPVLKDFPSWRPPGNKIKKKNLSFYSENKASIRIPGIVRSRHHIGNKGKLHYFTYY